MAFYTEKIEIKYHHGVQVNCLPWFIVTKAH